MDRIIKTSVGDFIIEDSILIVRFYEGVNVELEHVPEINEILVKEFKNPFVWISDKLNSYSVNPLIVIALQSENPFIRGYANVLYGNDRKDTSKFGKKFFTKDFPSVKFDTLDAAKNWSIELLK